MIDFFSRNKNKPQKRNIFTNDTRQGILDFKEKFKQKLMSRRSIRTYNKKHIDFELIFDMIEIAFNSPCVYGIMNYEIILIDDREKILEIAKNSQGQYWLSQANYLIVVLNQEEKLENNYPKNYKRYGLMNTSAFTQSIINSATLLGLSSCWVEAFDKEKVSKIVNCSNNEIFSIITLGYTDEESKSPLKPSLDSLVHYNKYGNKERKSVDSKLGL